MTKSSLSLLFLAALSLSAASCGPHSREGAVVGGLIGAGTGAIIGHQSGRGLEGAAIGGAIGAGAGALVGSAQDDRYYYRDRYHHDDRYRGGGYRGGGYHGGGYHGGGYRGGGYHGGGYRGGGYYYDDCPPPARGYYRSHSYGYHDRGYHRY